MDIKIAPKRLKGRVTPPPSKSIAHRAIIAASLSNGESKIKNISYSEDIISTIEAMEVLGARISKIEDGLKVKGIFLDDTRKTIDMDKNIQNEYKNIVSDKDDVRYNEGKIKSTRDDEKNTIKTINCRESGSTIRFLIPILTLFEDRFELKTEGRLLDRPMKPYFDIFDKDEIFYEKVGNTLKIVGGKNFSSRKFYMDGAISSQFITGMLFTLPLLEGDSEIVIQNKLESRSYIDLTINTLKEFGIEIENKDYEVFKISGSQKYMAKNFTVESDYSQAAFFLVAKALGNALEIQGLEENSLQGDREIVNLIKLYEENKEEKIVIDGREIPDIIPIFSLLAALKEGRYTEINNLERLKIKESDRLFATYSELKKLGAKIEIEDVSLKIWGQNSLRGGVEVSSHKDHRIAMMLAIAATRCEEEIFVLDAESVKKSYPDFWEVYENLGGVIWRQLGEEILR